MNEENSRASIRAREAEKAHSIRTFLQARGAKKKDPNCIQIRVLLWCRKWDSALRVRSACAPRSACGAAALPGPYKSPTGAFAIRGFESLIAKQKPPRWGGLCFGAGSGTLRFACGRLALRAAPVPQRRSPAPTKAPQGLLRYGASSP